MKFKYLIVFILYLVLKNKVFITNLIWLGIDFCDLHVANLNRDEYNLRIGSNFSIKGESEFLICL